jgi:flagellar hook-associated protein 2
MSTSSITPLQMTGVSSMSNSLQQILSRAVSIAQIPLTQLQNKDTDVLQEKTLLSGLSSAASSLGDAVAKLGTLASGGALSASSSDSTKVTAQNTGAATAVSYTLSNITLASAASGTSAVFTDSNAVPVSLDGKMVVEIDGRQHSITLATNSLVGLRDAINNLGAGVTATILTAGATANYLSVSSNTTGQLSSLKILDDPALAGAQTFTTTNLGSSATAATASTASLPDVDTTAVSANGSMRLVVGSQNYDFALGSNTLTGLRDAINGLGAGVTASIISNAAGDQNYISVTADSTGKQTSFDLIDDPGGAATGMFQTTDLGVDPTTASASTGTYADATTALVSASGSMTLSVGETDYNLDLASNTLTGLRDAINAAGAGVTASLVTNGSVQSLSLTANTPGALSKLQLVDNPAGSTQNLLTSVDLGSDAAFKLNGIDVTHKTNLINDVVPGLTFNLVAPTTGTGTVTLSLATDRSQISSAISAFVTAYNAMTAQTAQQVGSNAGLLTGDYAVRELQQATRALASYSGTGMIQSLSDMGLTFDNAGKLSFDTAAFGGLSDTQIQGTIAFFGSSTSGFASLASKFTAITDPVTGTIKLEQNGLDQTDKNLQSSIATIQDRITAMQINLMSRLQVADTLIAGLESQKNLLTASIAALNYSLYGYQSQQTGN